jgi:hypothetical protein
MMATASNNVIKGMHFHAYKSLRKSWQKLVFAALGGVLPKAPIDKSFLVITRYCAGAGLDWDNAYGGLKPLLDCLVMPSTRNPDGLGLIVDDNPKNMPYAPFVKQEKAKMRDGRTVVQIFELT